MAGVTLAITLDGDAALKALASIGDRARNTRGMFELIGAALVTSTQHRFETGTAPDGSPWPPSLRARAQGGKTLLETGRLMRSVTYQASDSGVEVGSNVVYAAIHQLGGEIKQGARKASVTFKRSKRTGELLPGFRKASKDTETREVSIGARTINMPARPFLGLDEDDNRAIVTIVDDWIGGGENGAEQ